MYIIGIDPSSKTGLVVLSEDSEFYFAHEITTTKVGFPRLKFFEDATAKLLSTYPPKLVVIEGYAHGGKFSNSFQYEIGTVIRMMMYKANIPWVDIPPTSLKSIITGGGAASKGKMMLEVFKRWGFDASTDNIADAYGLSRIGKAILGLDTLTKASMGKITKIESVQTYLSTLTK
jgi:crossover junction endodeoxyribonuclease RuvC